jgi:rhodanese-related sulfurtransferase
MQQVSVRNVATLIDSLGAERAPVLLDVREPWEIETASITLPGTKRVLIPMNEIPQRMGELDPAQPVLSLCHHGMRSMQVAVFLERQGFAQVFNIAGGIDAWSREVDASVPLY